MQRMTWGLGYVPEQVWEDPDTPASPFGTDPTTASIGFSNGKAAGSAAPLIWGQAQYLRLVLDLQAGTLIDQPQITRARYLGPAAPTDVPVTITSPANGARVTGATTVVTGTTRPGARVDVAAGQPGSAANTSTVVATVADSDGAYTATIPTPAGTTTITAAATVGADGTGWAQETVTG
jgi:glucoamylase